MQQPDADETEVSTEELATPSSARTKDRRRRPRALETPALEAVVVDGPSNVEGFRARYQEGELIGRGGMGDVVEHTDRLVGRRIAVKVLRSGFSGDSGLERRFLREARVQGQLEHPAIVPVYDLVRNEQGELCFSMKRIEGVTLKEVLTLLHRNDPEAHARFTRRKLLSSFITVCQAMGYAHMRGVVHRDLKPGNVMLGAFGEVYVIDWGIAKVLDVEDPESSPVYISGEVTTEVGDFVGTAGYASPEQVQGLPVTPHNDVYSLGAILFEILTMKRLHPQENAASRVGSTLTNNVVPPSTHNSAVPPELDDIVMRCIHPEAGERFANANQLSLAVEAFLDGELNLTLRRELADEHAAAAHDALKGRQDLEARRDAMRALGRALALDPNHADAARSLRELLVTPPRDIPREVEVELERDRSDEVASTGKIAGVAYLSFLVFIPLLMWAGVRDWLAIVAVYACFLASAGVALFASKTRRAGLTVVVAAISSLGIAFSTAFFGALVLVPAMVIGNTAAFSMVLTNRERLWALAFGIAAMLVPLGLEAVGVIETSYAFAEGEMRLLPRALEVREMPTMLLLTMSNVASLVVSVVATGAVRTAALRGERRLRIYSWHIRALFPEADEVADED